MRILIVGDDQQDAPELSSKLTAEGFAVKQTSNARDALNCARRLHPDVIIADIDMPSLDSVQFAQYIRKTRWGRLTALIARTSLASHFDKQQAMDAGFDLYLARPVGFEMIRSLLDKCR